MLHIHLHSLRENRDIWGPKRYMNLIKVSARTLASLMCIFPIRCDSLKSNVFYLILVPTFSKLTGSAKIELFSQLIKWMSFYSVTEKWTNLFCDCGFCRVEDLFQLIFHWKNSCTFFLKKRERWKYGTSASPRGIVSRLWTMRSIVAWGENNCTETLLSCNNPCFQFDSVHVNLKE